MPPSVTSRKSSPLVVSRPPSHRPASGIPIHSTALPSTIAAASAAVITAPSMSRRFSCVITVCTQYHSVLVHCALAMKEPIAARVNRASGVPLGTQLVDQFRDAVADGRLGERDRLPSVRELAHSAGVNVNTVRAVYARLEAEG